MINTYNEWEALIEKFNECLFTQMYADWTEDRQKLLAKKDQEIVEARKEAIEKMCGAAMSCVSFGIPPEDVTRSRAINRQIDIEREDLLKNQV